MNKQDKKIHAKIKQKLSERLQSSAQSTAEPVMRAKKIHYQLSDRVEAIDCGGLGTIHMLAQISGLIEAIDRDIHLLKEHRPYHESDHVLNMCYNLLVGNKCLDDLRKLRENPTYMDALDAERIPAPSTAGDFLRRFAKEDIEQLMDTVNQIRIEIWKLQSKRFRRQATIAIDATIEETTGECKEGTDLSYDKRWGYAPLVVSLMQTREPLFLENRPGNTPSHHNAAIWLNKALDLTEQVFERTYMVGDTDYGLTGHFDNWDDRGAKFIFGYDARPNLVEKAENIEHWRLFQRPIKRQIKTEPRQKRQRVKDDVVKKRGYKHLRQVSEHIAEFDYQPGKCDKVYRVVVIKKTCAVTCGEQRLPDEIRYLFYITNDRWKIAEQVVLFANQRCDHENDIEQLRNGVHALKMPTGDLTSNWAYMVIASLAWTLKSWMGLLMPQKSVGYKIIRMEFRKFFADYINIPVQILRRGRQLWYRIIGYMECAATFFRFVEVCHNLRL